VTRTVSLAGLAALAFAAPSAAAQTPALTSFTNQFDRYIREASILGGSFALVRDGRVVATHYVGFADVADRQMVDSNTIYQYGSITKTLAAITVLQLRDRGKLSLDEPATKYLPELRRVYDPFGSPDSITIRMLLTHTSGFQNPTWPWTSGQSWEPFEPTTWEQLVAMLPYQKLAFKPGTQWSYSNPAFIYAARIVEVITGEPWLVYVQKNVFAPLGMTRSYFSATPYHLAAFRSNNYTIRRDSVSGRIDTVANGRDFDPGITNPNGGWNAPLGDVVKWMTFLLDPARDKRLLTPSSWDEIRRQVVATTSSTTARPEYIGLTFFLLPRGGTTFVGHTGSQNGFNAFMYLNPATRSGIIVAFNTAMDWPPRGAYKELAEASLELLR